MHTGEKTFKCDQCNYTSAEAGKVKVHKRKHTGEKPPKCDQCSYCSNEASKVKLHMQKQTGDKPFKCDQCNYSATQATQKHTKGSTLDKSYTNIVSAASQSRHRVIFRGTK